ncbi:CoA ester lyase [Sphingomonas ginkgonis]|uniref:CoA ester lyase n=1 Tax=Sphingomonas ginkgonis TaxID=2315330 RepID=A0A429VCL3_9SPHN|nr:CoA ester lyase [Sphingomonas ginkgonis]RST31735.1 CoA ester lyase [Sphingomonas ginkgonis]
MEQHQRRLDRLRSLLFVPGDRPERFDKGVRSGADALILDLEDSVGTAAKPQARANVRAALEGRRTVPLLVRVNPLGSEGLAADLAAAAGADAIVLPKAEGAASVRALASRLVTPAPILPIATETPAAIFELGSYREVGEQLAGLSWGAEDLPAAIGATTSRDESGRYLPPYELARSLTLFAAHAAGVPAIDTVYPAIRDVAGVAAYAARAARDGFTAMLALHPDQIGPINAAFTPSPEAVDHARRVVAAFAARPAAGVLDLDGAMIDAPHRKQAERILARAARAD